MSYNQGVCLNNVKILCQLNVFYQYCTIDILFTHTFYSSVCNAGLSLRE